MFDLKNKGVIITGASRGLGSVCAKAFSEHGARLVLIARSSEGLEEVRKYCANPEKHLSIPTDMTELDRLQMCIPDAKKFLGEIDAVLHVAGGGLGLRDSLITAADLYKLFTLNVVAAVEINRLIAPDMIKRGKGNLVHVGSIASSEATASVGYNTVKAALAAYVRSLGNEFAYSGVVATGILPGGFYSPGNSWERLEKTKPEVVQNFIQKKLPRKHMAKAEELIPLLMFLCSDAASMMGGCLVPIDAGEGRAYLVD